MGTINVIIFDTAGAGETEELLSSLKANPSIDKIVSTKNILSANKPNPSSPYNSDVLAKALQEASGTPYVMLIHNPDTTEIVLDEIKLFINRAKDEKEGSLFYSDYYMDSRSASSITQVIEYQQGSIRDDFDFGPVQILSAEHVMISFKKFGPLSASKWAGLYDLKLRLSLTGKIVKLQKPLSLLKQQTQGSHFGYLDPDQKALQAEMERTASAHLKRTKALCTHRFMSVPDDPDPCPVTASIIIPVKNREKTISDAVKSALNQKTDFKFNVLVVQNHSTDKTAEQIDSIAKTDSRIIHIIPERKDLGIGGCWNEAINSSLCGRFVCQLDSDDLYINEHTLAAVVEMLKTGQYGMVVGSYRVVNFNLEEIPPGIVDHSEWTEENGRNNLLRVNGIGAPRAFTRILLREVPFPNVSYGEDYAVSLRISRDYKVGRIFEPLYLCRRWEENSDAMLSREQANTYALYKDKLRTEEIIARQSMNTKTIQTQ